MAMELTKKPAFVLIHGAWHDHHTWDKIAPRLAAQGFAALAIDLPGAGVNAKIPTSFGKRPFDPVAFAQEPSPNAHVTQDERNQATLNAIAEATKLGNGEVVLVGHSLAGLTLSPVTEMMPSGLAGVVYLTAHMLPNGAIIADVRATANVPPLYVASPREVGALRMAVNVGDAAYMVRVREVFYGDVSDADFAFVLQHLHCDEPVQVVGERSPITAVNFGTIPRHYIRCTQDLAITIEGQDRMIELVDSQMDNKAVVHTLETSHSPFFSAPDQLAEILMNVANH